jgi:hypothetical protein
MPKKEAEVVIEKSSFASNIIGLQNKMNHALIVCVCLTNNEAENQSTTNYSSSSSS